MTGNVVANKWLASVGGEIVGEGTTPSAAVTAANARLAGIVPTLSYVENDTKRLLPLNPVIDGIRHLIDNLPMPVYLVGGVVRDALLQHASHDIDLAVPVDAIKLAYVIGDDLRVPVYELDDERDVGRVMLPRWRTRLDIARFRGSDLEEDLYGRDFTINAMALPGTAQDASSIIDLHHGLDDLHAGLVRIVHANSISDDPIRALRAIRLTMLPGFVMTPDTAVAVRAGAAGLRNVSPERVRDELLKLIISGQPDQALSQMAELGLLQVILPEVAALAGVEQSPPHHEAVLEHTASVLRWLRVVEASIEGESNANDPAATALVELLQPYRKELSDYLNRPIEGGLRGSAVLRLGGLFHDTGKAETQTIDQDGRIRFLGHDAVSAKLAGQRMKALSFSNEAGDLVAAIADGHMRPLHLAAGKEMPSRRAVYRFFRATHTAGIDIVLLSLADHLATYNGPGDEKAWADLLAVNAELMATYFTAFDSVVRPARLVTGSDLIRELHLQPGPEVGRLLGQIEEAQAAGLVTTSDEALSLARRLLPEKK